MVDSFLPNVFYCLIEKEQDIILHKDQGFFARQQTRVFTALLKTTAAAEVVCF
jgi:hypothetical protein